MSYYHRHVFFCCNQRPPDELCCEQANAEAMYLYVKDRIKALGLKDRIRINRAGCLGRCEEGPCLVVYPEAVWYSYRSTSDLDEIINEHLSNG